MVRVGHAPPSDDEREWREDTSESRWWCGGRAGGAECAEVTWLGVGVGVGVGSGSGLGLAECAEVTWLGLGLGLGVGRVRVRVSRVRRGDLVRVRVRGRVR